MYTAILFFAALILLFSAYIMHKLNHLVTDPKDHSQDAEMYPPMVLPISVRKGSAIAYSPPQRRGYNITVPSTYRRS